jgi:ribulose-5-phosphate 4-epimerase/fuculose-1-phosphate aldolase
VRYQAEDPRDQLGHVGSSAVAAGLVVGSGGNLSARQPGEDEFWVTAAGTWLDRLDRADFSRVSLTTGSVVGNAPSPTTEFQLHVATYRVRPDVNAIVHLHPQTVVLLSALGKPIRLLSTDHAYYLRRVADTPFHPPGSAELARVAAAATADGTDCVVLGRHGCSVLGPTVELAHKRALYLEEAARLTYRALLLGLPDTVADMYPEKWSGV